MDLNKATEKTREALSQAQVIAVKRGHQSADEPHLLLAMLGQDNGLAPRIVAKLNLEPAVLAAEVEKLLAAIPSVRGPGVPPGQIAVTRELNELLVRAADEADAMKDEYVSIEHVLVAFLTGQQRTPTRKLLESFNITQDRLRQAVKTVRGGQRVTSATPEATYEALLKYGRDLVQEAKDGKLTPVIGRDE